MESSLQKIIAAVVGVMILFIIPVYIVYEKVDDISYSLVLRFTQTFVDNVREKGYISPEAYGDFARNVYSTGNSYDIQIEHTKKRYDPAIYVYGVDGTVLYILDYDKYIDTYNETKENGTIKIEIEGVLYENNRNCIITLGHTLNEEIITDRQIVNKLFEGTKLSKLQFLADCLSGNVDLYNSLAYINENSYTMNEGDKVTVTVKNKNKTIASVFYSLFTANVGDADISKIYVNYGGTIKNNGATLLSNQEGSVLDASGRVFKYTGSAEEITLTPGEYEIECWGASGGGYYTVSNVYTGGKGAYAKAKLTVVAENQTLYVYVGGAGSEYSESNQENGGWNGGGNSYQGYGGGGATDIRLIKGDNDSDALSQLSLLSRIIIAAGGGGSSKTNGMGGNAGSRIRGFDGKTTAVNKNYVGKGATMGSISTINDYKGSLGSIEIENTYESGSVGSGGKADYLGAGAGGAGLIGGSASHNANAGGGGGISYIYNNDILRDVTCEKIWEFYEEVISNSNIKNYVDGRLRFPIELSNIKWKNINVEKINISNGNKEFPNPLSYNGTAYVTGNIGNGFVRIKKIS